ncbi:Molybdopterin molybdenumtransferase [Frondihabitans sp. 762G35]|uniref:molybdopterin molybdotransferase MoeA n=1 Tax=Frondihabitans sp. 762G35 TaxID=1446794 RepID=UPI000D211DFF|nr:molybdopterin molybdotransferase MoeA [Frondihabitans sp. 762G35]ARC58411.1 Molybdopterin molybdenumtransferase [Frondihabitans sp. 762G35]
MTLSGGSWLDARAETHRQALLRATPTVMRPLVEAAGATLTLDLLAPGDVPGHDGSAMDGWATAGAPPWLLGEPLVAGDVPATAALADGHARPVTTGAPVPPGTDAVLRSEDGLVEPGDDGAPLLHRSAESTRRHIRPAGEEVRAGDLLFARGVVLTPPRAALAAASGVDEVPVARPPRAALVVLGDEIVRVGVPRAGRVRDVFSGSVPGILRSAGVADIESAHAGDDPEATRRALDVDADLVVSTGGTGHSSADHVRSALDALGAEILVERISMRPGRPLLLARVGDRLHLCLPGNPMAAMVGLVLVGLPLIDGLLGRPLRLPEVVRLAEDLRNDSPQVVVLAYRSTPDGAVAARRQTAAMLRGLADADGLLVVPPGGALRGSDAPALDLPW